LPLRLSPRGVECVTRSINFTIAERLEHRRKDCRGVGVLLLLQS
jgi:hypothetical protein